MICPSSLFKGGGGVYTPRRLGLSFPLRQRSTDLLHSGDTILGRKKEKPRIPTEDGDYDVVILSHFPVANDKYDLSITISSIHNATPLRNVLLLQSIANLYNPLPWVIPMVHRGDSISSPQRI